MCRVARTAILAVFIIIPNHLEASYDESCGMYAQFLWSASDQYESAKSSFETACAPGYGFSANDEAACGAFGYERSSYDNAKSELESAISNVAIFCGTGDRFLRMIRRLEAENKKLKAKIKSLSKSQ